MQSKQWRIVGITPLGTGGWSANAFHLYSAGSRVDASGVLTASVAPVSGAVSSLANAAPGAAVVWTAAQVGAPGFCVMWTFAADVDVTEFRYAGGPLACFSVEAKVAGAWQVVRNAMTVTNVSATALSAWPLVSRPDLTGAAACLPGETDIDAVTGAAWRLDGAVVQSEKSRSGLPTLRIQRPSSVNYPPPLSVFTSWSGQDMTIEATVLCDAGVIYDAGLPLFIYNGDASPGTNYWSFGPRLDGSVAFFYWSGFQNVIATAPGTFPFGSYVRIAVSVKAGVMRLFINGQMLKSFVMTAMPSSGGNDWPVRIGSSLMPSEFWVSDVAFWPSGKYTEDYVIADMWDRPRALKTQQSVARVSHSSPLEPHKSCASPGTVVARDTEFGGPGEYPFKVEGLPTSQKARVSLLRARDRLPARETWSAADGTGTFTGLDLSTKFIAMAQAPNGVMQPCGAEHFPRLPEGA